jgi:transglutaminase-like putative cysteine protease
MLFFITSMAGALPLLTRFWNPEPSAKSVSQSPVSQRQFRFWYEVKVKNIPSGSQLVRAWLPVPKSNRHQRISDLKIETDHPFTIYEDKDYANKILRVEAKGRAPENFVVGVSFTVSRGAFSALGETIADPEKVSGKTLQRFLSPDRLIPITGQIKEEAEKVVSKEMTDFQKAKAIYEYVSGNLTYDKSGTGWGQGDAVFACNSLRGNCTDFHSLFIGMARAVGVPARFVMGFPLPNGKNQGEILGYHCWAEFYVQGKGWIPVDASEASKQPELKDFYFGNLDPNRVEFTIGRDIQLDPDQLVEPQNFFIYPVVMVNDTLYTDVQTLFHFSSN